MVAETGLIDSRKATDGTVRRSDGLHRGAYLEADDSFCMAVRADLLRL